MKPMRFLAATLFALAGATAAQATTPSASDFRLPAERGQPPPDRQGPVAPDVPESRRPPPPQQQPQSTASGPEPVPVIEVPEAVVVPPSSGSPQPAPSEAARPQGQITAASPEAEASIAPDAPTVEVSATPPPISTAARPADGPARGSWWIWAGLLLLLAMLGSAVRVLVSRKVARLDRSVTPQIERPRLGDSSMAEGMPPAPHASGTLQIDLEPVRLSLTLMNAALSYRLVVTNRGTAPLHGVVIGADMISAHASLSRDQQLSGPAGGSAALREIGTLAPGESRAVDGEFRLPFQEIVPIRQGRAALLLPLARFRVEGEGATPVARTFVIGQPGERPGAKLQPFRLDLGPRIYPEIEQRAFA